MDSGTADRIIEDADVIRDVLAGRRDQFQELIFRYADKVYAVAWSRLGDRHLAEEVVQETFIQGFQQLHRLKDTDKFLPWISAIARNRAINQGMRFRNELKRRERWALEQTASDGNPTSDADTDSVNKETLRATLASMKGLHRECLTMFYLQGKSVDEASKTLGISTSNFKTRLHRARAALRSKLESVLETELNRFKPSDQVRHGIMAVILAKTSSGSGFKAMGTWLSTIPFFSNLFLLVQLVVMIPGFLLAKWTLKQHLDNFRDQEGYRAKILRTNTRNIYWSVVVIALCYLAFTFQMDRVIILGTFYLIFLAYSIAYVVQYCVLKYQFPPAIYLGFGVFLICIGMAVYDASFHSLILVPSGYLIVLSGFPSRFKGGEGRLDHSIFLRISDLMRQSKPDLPKPLNKSFPPTTTFIKSFIEFLSSNSNLISMRREVDGVRTWTHPVQASGLKLMFAPFFRGGMSTLFFGNNGTIKAKLGKKDRGDLIRLGLIGENDEEVAFLEEKTESVLHQAWGFWSNGQIEMAKFALGYEHESQIFKQPPERLLGNRFRWAVTITLGVLMMLLGGWQHLNLNWRTPFEVKRMRKPNITEAEAKAYIHDFLSDKVPSQVIRKRLLDRISNASVVPPADWLTEENKQKIREYLDTFKGIDAETIKFKRINNDFSIDDLEYYNRFQLPLESLFDLEFIKEIDWNEKISNLHPSWKSHDFFWVNDNIFADSLYRKLKTYSKYVDLKQLDFTAAHQRLIKMQCLDTSRDFAEYKRVDTKKVHGLFLGNFSPLHDTWTVLSVMEMTGGLDKIDKEACIEGILRLHYGGGRFYLRAAASKKHMNNGAYDTWLAFQSLRILNALNRVDDLTEWEFLLPFKIPVSSGRSKDFELNGHHWNDVEAFLMQKQFDTYVQNLGMDQQL